MYTYILKYKIIKTILKEYKGDFCIAASINITACRGSYILTNT